MSVSKHKCCVPGCADSGGSHKVLHLFPHPEKEIERFRTWVLSIDGDIIGMENNDIYKQRRVCHAHFKVEHCCRRERLSKIAVPTLNMPARTSLAKFTDKPQKRTIQNMPSMPSTSSSSPGYVLFEDTPPRVSTANTEISQELMKENIELNEDRPTIAKPTNITTIHGTMEQSTVPMPSRRILREIQSPPKIDREIVKAPIPITDRIQTKKTKRQKMTKIEQTLYQKLNKLKMKLSKCKNKLKNQKIQIKAARNIVENPKFLNVLDCLPSTAKILTMLQFREHKKKYKGRRFTMDEKLIALSILKQSPKGYRFLRKIFILPAQQTLIKLINLANIKPGININIFAQLKKKAEKIKIEERLCVLLFDEMSLKANLAYNERKDKIIGLVSNEGSSKNEFADHAQVFMVRGLVKNYKQPVAYTFSQAATKGPDLARQIKEIINELQKAGFIVLATVCDQGSNNRQAIKLLIQESKGYCLREGRLHKENVFLINNEEIVTIYDPPHLLKGIRNNLLTKNLQYTIKGKQQTAKWQHLEMFHKENPTYKGIRLVKKITDNHIIPQKIGKMRVKFAAQLFSETVAGNMGYLADKGILPAECKETADMLIFWDKLFDSFNGSFIKNKHAKPLLGPCTSTSPHKQHWAEAKKILDTMKFIDKKGKIESVPSLNNWKWTINSVLIMLNNLEKKYGVNSVWMRHLNQDPLENFFGAIRSHGCRNTNPTPEKFESAYASLLISNIASVHAAGSNCENDFCQALHALLLTEDDDNEENITTEININEILNIKFKNITEMEDVRIKAPLQYVSGYFVRQAKKKIYKSCTNCKLNLMNPTPVEYIKYREYGSKNWLCSPSDEVLQIISQMQVIVIDVIKNELAKDNLKAYIKTVISMLVDFSEINCMTHKNKIIEFLMNIVVRFFLHNYCKNINLILSGRKEIVEDEDTMQIKAKKYHKKCFKRQN